MSPSNRVLGFDLPHSLEQTAIVVRSISTCVHAAMAVWAKRDDVSWMIGPAIAYASNVVRFEISGAVWSTKRRRRGTSLAMPFGSSEHVFLHVSGSLIDVSSACYLPRRENPSGSHCSLSKLAQAGARACVIGLIVLDDCVEVSELEHNGVSEVAFAVRRTRNLVVVVDQFANETEASAFFAEEQEATTINGVVADCAISSSPGHITQLTFAKILEHAVCAVPISVPVFQAFFASDDYDERVLLGGDDASLLLPAKSRVNVRATVVDAIGFKAPSQRHSPPRGLYPTGIEEECERAAA